MIFTMVKKKPAGSFPAQADEIVREEALKIARAAQAPGQSREETKLIAKGIAKGIAEYKKQENIRQRERARLQRKLKSAGNAAVQNPDPRPIAAPSIPSFNRLPGLAAAGIFPSR